MHTFKPIDTNNLTADKKEGNSIANVSDRKKIEPQKPVYVLMCTNSRNIQKKRDSIFKGNDGVTLYHSSNCKKGKHDVAIIDLPVLFYMVRIMRA